MKESDQLWQAAMKDLLDEENQREKEEERRQAQTDEYDDDWDMPQDAPIRQLTTDRNVNLEEGVHVNYDQKYWRKSATGAS
jgi:hypothetical protein